MKTLETLLEITAYSVVLYGAIMLIKLCFKQRMSPFLHLALWGLLLARLMLPFTLESSVRLFVIPNTVAETTTLTDALSEAEASAPASLAPGGPGAQAQPQEGSAQTKTGAVSSGAPSAPVSSPFPVAQALPALWLAGAGLGLAYLALLYGLTRRRIKANAEEPSTRLRALFNEVRAELNAGENARLVGQRGGGTPAALFPATVLAPTQTLEAMDDEQARFALRHELTHLRRGDHMLVLLLSLLNAVYWFNPVVYLAFAQVRKDMETACDSDVVRALGGAGKRAYAAVILSLFSGGTHGALALGMAQGDTKKIAERRIRGVFMPRNSHRLARAVCAALTALMLFCCFTTACQPTPQEEVVVNKGDNDLENAIASTPPLGASDMPYEAPEHYTGAETFFDGLVTLTFDMDTIVPAVTKYPVYEASPADFTGEQAQKIISALMGNAPMTYADETMSKQEILENYLLPAMKDLEAAKSGETVGDDGGPESVEDLEARVNMFQQWYDNAPETKDTRPVTAADYAGMDIFLAQADLGKPLPATLRIAKSSEFQTCGTVKFINGTEYIYNGFENPTGDLPLETTRDEAVARATELVERLGATDFVLAAVGKTTRLGSEYDISSDEYQNTQAYSVVFMRMLEGVPFGYCSIDQYSGGEEEDDVSRRLPAYERIMVIVDDGGVANVFWNGNMKIGTLLNANVALLPFDDIVARATEQLKLQCSYLQDTGSVEGTLGVTHFDLVITRAELKFMYVRQQNSLDFITVPVWDFYGVGTTYYNHDDVDAFNREHPQLDWSMPYEMASEFYYYEYVTVNAVDGSVVNRHIGY
ncbi:MAG TPA: DUF6034 family protein [Clostridia bacterium]|nr:DUF6034 family protein [Clostridia bacterium]